jgi:hypothetical protein
MKTLKSIVEAELSSSSTVVLEQIVKKRVYLESESTH